MTITRFLLTGVVLGALVVPASAQFGGSTGYNLVPSVRPAGGEDPLPSQQQLPPQIRPAVVASLEQMGQPQPGGPAGGDPVGTLTGAPSHTASGLPPGSYPSPYYVDGPGCCGPLGRDGRIGYEVYTYTGADFMFGPGLGARVHPGITVGGGTRSLFFNADHTAAWTIDLGLSFSHNNGTRAPTDLYFRSQPTVVTTTNVVTPVADVLTRAYIREYYHESFNYNVGRDWWLWGAGNTGGETGTNIRAGGWIGGRWGSSHVDMVPMDNVFGYSRRQGVYESAVIGAHLTFETPMGGWILFGGVRAEYGFTWSNVAPPINANYNEINIQLTAGIRF